MGPERPPARAGGDARAERPGNAGAGVAPARVRAFGPGRVCLIGEHTDYNHGLALAFAIAQGVTVEGRRLAPAGAVDESVSQGSRGSAAARVIAHALDLGEEDELTLAQDPPPASGWRAFVRGTVAELHRAGLPPVSCELTIHGDVPRGAGMSSSAALEVSLALALLALAGAEGEIERTALARLCSRVENEWAGARTGLLDQLTSLHGAPATALRIDFATLAVEPVALRLDGWRLATLDSGERRSNASSGYNRRRAECARACELLGVASLREVTDPEAIERLPDPLRGRARHVITDNARVEEAVAALRAGDLAAVGDLLNEAHGSLREDMDVSTPAVESTVAHALAAGAAGARLLGGGFGGSVLALFGPGVSLPAGAREVRPCAGARVDRL